MKKQPADEKLPFPTKWIQCNGGACEEYIIPDEKKQEVLERLYPFLPVPSLDEKRLDLHEDKTFRIVEFKVVYDNGMNMLVSPYYFSSGGSVIDWMPVSSCHQSTGVGKTRKSKTATKTNQAFSPTAPCGICGEEVKLSSAKLHLKNCRLQNPHPMGKKDTEIFMLQIRGQYLKDYVLFVEMPGTRTLKALDVFLRRLWLECCGHLSAFTISGKTYDSCPEEFIFPGKEPHKEMFEVKLSEVLTPRLKFTYEYDFGSSTDLELEVIDVRKTFEKLPTKPVLLMRNKPPQYKCCVCGDPATIISAVGFGEESGEFFCSTCAEDQAETQGDQFYGMHLVNSPRTGVCGYDTPT